MARGLDDGGRQLQVLGHTEVDEHVFRLRHEGQALEHHAVSRGAGDVAAIEQHAAAADRHKSGHRFHQRRFARTVRAEDGEDLTGLDRQAGVSHNRQAGFVASLQRFNDQDRGAAHAGLPR